MPLLWFLAHHNRPWTQGHLESPPALAWVKARGKADEQVQEALVLWNIKGHLKSIQASFAFLEKNGCLSKDTRLVPGLRSGQT